MDDGTGRLESSRGGLTRDSNSLREGLITRLFARVQQDLHVLDRPEGRMHQKHFPTDDELYERVKLARVALRELSIQLHRLMLD